MKVDIFSLRKNRSIFALRIRIIVSILVFIVISAIMLYDTFLVQGFIAEKTQRFVRDLTFQHAASVTQEFSTRKLSIQMVAASLNKTRQDSLDAQVEDFLRQKLEYSVFNAIHFIESRESTEDEALASIYSEYLKQFSNDQQELPPEDKDQFFISSVAQDSIYYVQPVMDAGGKLLGLVIGVRIRNELQDFIQLKAFNNETVTCIVDRNSNVIISPTSKHLPSHRIVDDYVLFQNTEENNLAIQEIRSNMQNLQQEVQRITNIDGTRLLASYTPLGINDWGLLTFIPENLISINAQEHLLRTFYTSVVAILIFGFITISAVYTFKKNKKQMESIAFSDAVTGGLNKDGFTLRFHEIVEPHNASQYSIVLINMQHFKLINEQYGKEKGDATIRHINRCIEKCLHPDEFVARFSADNFFLCLKSREPQIIETRLHYISAEINAFNANTDNQYNLEFNCGIRLVDEAPNDLIKLQDHAHLAYNHAVAEKLFCVFYDQAFINRLLKEQELNMMFEDSLNRGDFKLYLQPKVRLDTGVVCGAEALVRWFHPEKGMIFPSDFIPLFEENGKICQLDLYMFKEVCKTLQRWQQSGRHLLPISFNLSRQHYFQNPAFLESFIQVAKEYHIPNGLLDFELTESIFFDNDKFTAVKKSLDDMHQHGFLCSLDDFGVGFSSLGLLKEFDIDTIKFDRQFFLDVSTEKSKTIVDSLMGMSKKLNIKTVAEGIETHNQLSYLNQTACDIIQGYIFSMPLEVREFELWLDRLENGQPSMRHQAT